MKSRYYKLALKSDFSFSKNAKTQGAHSCLPYIPGGVFLGVCAQKIYADIGEDSFAVFHSGAVRFGNAYPLYGEGHPSCPIPLSWHVPKSEKHYDNMQNRLLTGNIYNLVSLSEETMRSWNKEGIQPKQIREGYFSASGGCVHPDMTYRLKTAIDRQKGGRSADSQLFGYESLNPGSSWYFTIDSDSHISDELLNLIDRALTEEPLHIGKSRTAEYGFAEVQRVDAPSVEYKQFEGRYIIIYCLSDIALRDKETGALTLSPKSEHFGIDNAEFIAGKSFLRTHTYAPFNGKRRRCDIERQVISKGSVIAFKPSKEMSLSETASLQQRLNLGIGMYLCDGLGKAWVNPDFLAAEKISFSENAGAKPFAVALAAGTHSAALPEIVSWLNARKKQVSLDKEALELSDKWAKTIAMRVKKLKEKAPGKTQWSSLRFIAVKSNDLNDLKKMLFDTNKGLCAHGVTKKKWDEEIRYEDSWLTFSSFIETVVIGKCPNFELVQKVLYLLGSKIPQLLNQDGV